MDAISLRVTVDENKRITVQLPSEVAADEYQLLLVAGKYTSPEALALFNFPPIDLPMMLDKVLLTTEEIYNEIDPNRRLEALELLRASNFETRSQSVRLLGIFECLETLLTEEIERMEALIEVEQATTERKEWLNKILEYREWTRRALHKKSI
jgi:hypothetical protein